MFGTLSVIEIIIILVGLVWLFKKLSSGNVPWLGMLLATFSLVALMFGITVLRRSASHPPGVHQEAVRVPSGELSTEARNHSETETARQTAILTRIEILEKELKQSSELSEAKPESRKQQLSPGDAAVAEKKEKEATSKQLEETKQLLEKAKQELKQENEKTQTKPRWMAGYLVIEKKNWQDHLAHPETIPDRFVISSGRFTTIKEARSDANRLAKVTISAKLKAFTGQTAVKYDEAWYQSILSRTFDEKLQVKIFDGSPSTMHREHLLVDLNPEKVAALLPELRETIVETRIYTAAGGFVGIMLASGLLSVVLSRRKDEK